MTANRARIRSARNQRWERQLQESWRAWGYRPANAAGCERRVPGVD